MIFINNKQFYCLFFIVHQTFNAQLNKRKARQSRTNHSALTTAYAWFLV